MYIYIFKPIHAYFTFIRVYYYLHLTSLPDFRGVDFAPMDSLNCPTSDRGARPEMWVDVALQFFRIFWWTVRPFPFMTSATIIKYMHINGLSNNFGWSPKNGAYFLFLADINDINYMYTQLCTLFSILWTEEILHRTTLDGWNPINNGISHLSTGAGFLPFTFPDLCFQTL
jgi:hypothetical protein